MVLDLHDFATPQYGHGLAGRWQAARTVLDQLDRLGTCRKAIADLLIPEADLHVVDRDAFGTLLSYLDEQYDRAIEQLRAALHE